MGTTDDFIIDMEYAEWVWEYIRGRSRVYWPDDERMTYKVEAGFDTAKYYRDGTWDKESIEGFAPEFQKQGDYGTPDFVESPVLAFNDDKVRSVYLAAISYTVIGSWYTFEVQEDEAGPATFDPIRLPVPHGMVAEAKEWARDRGGSFVREKGVEFQERFATVLDGDEARLAASDLNDVHVKIPEVAETEEAKDIVREATDFAERGVRQVT